jgi:serine/threonine protein kinase
MPVAVKEFGDSISYETVVGEFTLQFRLHHKNVLRSLALVKCPRGVTGIMLPRGTPLNELLRPFDEASGKRVVDGSIAWARRVKWALGIAEAVTYIHGEGIAHRDLKSANVIVVEVDGDAVAQVTDFGSAKILESMGGTIGTLDPVGTVPYMAPELILPYEGKRTYFEVDVYALAVLVWETLSGEEPFRGKNTQAQMASTLRDGGRPMIPEQWPEVMRKAIAKGWSQEPGQRGSADDMRKALGGP